MRLSVLKPWLFRVGTEPIHKWIMAAVVVSYPVVASAGPPVPGTILYELANKAHFNSYELTRTDRHWIKALAKRLRYDGGIVVFLKTDLPLKKNDAILPD